MLNINRQTVSGQVAGKQIEIETGYYAKQANGAVLVSCGNTQLLACVTMSSEDIDRGFFPLTVDYIEKFYSTGRIPGSYNRREGRPTDHEVLTSRIIDRPLRPLFPDELKREVQVVVTVLSQDTENPPDSLAGFAASAALAISDIPFDNLIGSVRVIKDRNGKYLINPSMEDTEVAELELMISGTKEAITMIEGEANEVSEEDMLSAVEATLEPIKQLIGLQDALVGKLDVKKIELAEIDKQETLKKSLMDKHGEILKKTILIKDKLEREKATKDLILSAIDGQLSSLAEGEDEEEVKKSVAKLMHEIESDIVREMIVVEGKRNDGRQKDELRPIECLSGPITMAHGSAVFTRGETQVLSTVAMGTDRDQQKQDLSSGSKQKSFFLHYNFPPYSVGEVGRFGSTGRREVGHGMLAERSLAKVFPKKEDFEFTIRIVSEVLESNGSSSMATICSSSMALMNAGVPIRGHVAGVAMGLVIRDGKHAILTDIAGLEDHLGDMDFKVAGTRKGITGFQLDIKVEGITIEIMKDALTQAKKARIEILDKMEATIKEASEPSSNAPKREKVKIRVDKIKNLIGVGGRNIKSIVEETGSDVSVNEEGEVTIFSQSFEQMEKTKNMIELSVGQPKVGSIFEGKVRKVVPFGIFVEIAPGLDGLCHISKFSNKRVENLFDEISEGETVKVKVEEVDDQGRVSLNRKVLL